MGQEHLGRHAGLIGNTPEKGRPGGLFYCSAKTVGLTRKGKLPPKSDENQVRAQRFIATNRR
jgi:hypothetical protein